MLLEISKDYRATDPVLREQYLDSTINGPEYWAAVYAEQEAQGAAAETSKPSGFRDPATVAPPFSLENGTEIIPYVGTGRGSLRVTNGTDLDAVVKLRTYPASELTKRMVYVRAHDEVILRAIQPGQYHLLFCLGIDWDSVARKFLRKQSYSKFADPFEFKETPASDGVYYSNFEVTLHPVPEGKARTLVVDEKEFDEPEDLPRRSQGKWVL
jgi:hypothetical protein